MVSPSPLLATLPQSAAAATLFAICALVLIVAVPILNLWVPPSSTLHVADYMVPLLGKYLCYALLALALDLVWGYCGVLSLGHGAFFALGGYAMGMYLMRQIGTRGVYQNPIVPDFMVFLNWKELPWYWYGFDHFWFAAAIVLKARRYRGCWPSSSGSSRFARASPASISRSSPRR